MNTNHTFTICIHDASGRSQAGVVTLNNFQDCTRTRSATPRLDNRLHRKKRCVNKIGDSAVPSNYVREMGQPCGAAIPRRQCTGEGKLS